MNPTPAFLSSPLALLLPMLLCICFSDFESHAQLIPKDEVKALQVIARKLNIRYWNVSQTACVDDGGTNFNNTISDSILSNVTCNCSYKDNTICHVTNIQLKGLNLSGVIPNEFASLSKLQEIDLTRNYISGSIPTSLVKIPLVKLALVGNHINGTIPKEIGQIPTLEELVLDDNLLGGQLPNSLGKLKRLRRLLLSANNFTGTIPESFGNLRKLNDFRIDGSTLSGRIPSFIGNWTNIKTLHMQGTYMEGPIPSTLALFTKITELRISDLQGSSMEFPNLKGLTDIKNLVLRRCLITGLIPEYIGDMEKLKILDLSFNRLTGPIPANFQKLNQNNLGYMFLTNNSLSGLVPSWIINSKDRIDVSYNNFTGSVTTSCQQSNVNLASGIRSTKGNSDSWCWKKDLPCPGKAKHYSLFINCGGTATNYDGNEYEEDSVNMGASYFSSTDSWALSSTGAFMSNEKNGNYITSAISGLDVIGPAYFQTARISPISLKYYGICMRKGSYTVKLHFAEIMFSNDRNYSSTGRRIFDVAIQGNVVLTDFNIMEEAGIAGKGITREFNNVLVNGSTLEVHLYWRGKGTNNVPIRGVYGPLINAITVTPNFMIHDKGLPFGAIIAIVAALLAVLVLILVVLKLTGFLGRKEPDEFPGLDTWYFSLRQIKAATDDFNPSNKIGEGGFGPVYKGVMSDGKVVAVKQLSSKSKQGNREFVNEIGMISSLQHPNLVKLHGCCTQGKELLLVYEYMENNSLARAILGNKKDERLNLDWPTRKKICLGIARGLAYLHEESRLKIVHRDIKATNVLLDKDFNAKISDFGLAKLDEGDNTHISTRVAGTIGYMAPEYAMRGYLTYKADVYSFGIVVLELVSGKSNTNYRPKEEFVYLLDWAYVLQEQGNLLELMDPSLGTHYAKEEALSLLDLALLCTNPSPSLRPVMSSVVSMIEGTSPVQAQVVKLTDIELRALSNMSRNTHSQASDGTPWINSREDDTQASASSFMLLEHVTL